MASQAEPAPLALSPDLCVGAPPVPTNASGTFASGTFASGAAGGGAAEVENADQAKDISDEA